MAPTRPLAALATILVVSASAQEPRRTVIDDYVQAADDSYAWQVAATHEGDGFTTVVVDMVSQHWLTPAEVDRTEWRHWLTLTIPDEVVTDIGMLTIGGGSNGGEPPAQSSERMVAIARATGGVVAELGMVPNQPLIFHGDGLPRYEDDLIAYAWDRFIQTGEARWLPRNAMVKSAVRGHGHGNRHDGLRGRRRTPRRSLRGGRGLQAGLDHVAHGRHGSARGRHHSHRHRRAERRPVPCATTSPPTDSGAPSVGDYVRHGIMEPLRAPAAGRSLSAGGPLLLSPSPRHA